jgi:hypothetical protein
MAGAHSESEMLSELDLERERIAPMTPRCSSVILSRHDGSHFGTIVIGHWRVHHQEQLLTSFAIEDGDHTVAPRVD